MWESVYYLLWMKNEVLKSEYISYPFILGDELQDLCRAADLWFDVRTLEHASFKLSKGLLWGDSSECEPVGIESVRISLKYKFPIKFLKLLQFWLFKLSIHPSTYNQFINNLKFNRWFQMYDMINGSIIFPLKQLF